MNNEDKIALINTILQLEKSIDNDINNAFSEMNLSSESEFIKIAKKYAIGEKYTEYTNKIILLQKNYLITILEGVTKIGNEKGLSKDKHIEYSGYLFGPKNQ